MTFSHFADEIPNLKLSPSGYDWTDGQIKRLRELHKLGHTPKEIAADLKLAPRVVNNKITSLKLTRPSSSNPRLSGQRLINGKKWQSIESEADQEKRNKKMYAIKPASPGLTLEALKPGECRFPYGDQVPYHFCGNKTEKGVVYCPAHHDMSRTFTKKWTV